MKLRGPGSIQSFLSPICIVLSGVLIGMLGGTWLGHLTAMNQAKSSLSQQAKQVVERGDLVFDELGLIAQQVEQSALPFCSDAELARLRALTFGSFYLKDVGRTREGNLYCSAFLGRLSTPYVEGPPTLRLKDSTQIYSSVNVVLASSNHDHGTVLERGGIDVVLAPSLFRSASGTHVESQVIGVDRAARRFATLGGANIASTTNLRFTPDSWIDSGILYHSECSSRYALCTLIGAPLGDLMRPARGTVVAYAAAGTFTGFGVALSLALWLARYKRIGPKLLRAIRNRSPGIGLLYQPILDINSQKYVGAEALMRWTDAKGRPIPPDVFVAVAEREGFINELTAFVIERSIREFGEHLRSDSKFTLSLNVAAADLSDESFFTLLQAEVKKAKILPQQIALELTERSTSDLDSICAAIRRLRTLGFKVHIDDFGTGFSSLSYLDRLDVDAIKIDRAFTRTIGTGAVTSSIIPQMLAMADNLKLEVIVEGVESEAQSNFLASAHEGLRAQGWHFGKPMSAEAFFTSKPVPAACSTEAMWEVATCKSGEKRCASNARGDLHLSDELLHVGPVDSRLADSPEMTPRPPVDELVEGRLAELVSSTH